MISRAATRTKTGNRRQLLVFDAKRAFLHVDALTGTYVKPPHLRDTDRCWLLKVCMYGTLLAAARSQHLVQKVSTDIGLLSSSNCPCHHRWIWRRPRMAIAETEREARSGAEGALGSRTRQINDSVEPLCDIQRLSVDVGSRLATRRVGSGNRRAQAAPSRTHHWTTKNWNLARRRPTTAWQQD